MKKRGLKIGIINILWIKPLKISKASIKCIANSKFGAILLDDDYVDGISNSLANKLSHMTDKKIFTLGLSDKSAGFHKKVDNLPLALVKLLKKLFL